MLSGIGEEISVLCFKGNGNARVEDLRLSCGHQKSKTRGHVMHRRSMAANSTSARFVLFSPRLNAKVCRCSKSLLTCVMIAYVQ